ncbi:MAG TPA: hypothetical protein VFT51_00370, partial [Bacillales bacterium]|nr:hypothetical protein [Bacillales bacterium]
GRNRSGKTPIPMAIFSVPLQTTSVISPGGGGTGSGSFTPVFGVMTGNQRMSTGSEGLLISSFQGLRDQWEHAPPLPPPKQASSFSNGII